MNEVMYAILSGLGHNRGSMNSTEIASLLALQGIRISDRTARLYLKRLDELGFTSACRRRARTITERGRRELFQGCAFGRLGCGVGRIEQLSVALDFDPGTGRGAVALDVNFVANDNLPRSLELLDAVSSAGYAVCDRIALFRAGSALGEERVPEGVTGIGTVSAMTVNGVILRSGIPVRPRVGGIIEIAKGVPTHFCTFISYEHSSVPPLEALLRCGMTSVLDVLAFGDGRVLGSFHEIPEVSLPALQRLRSNLKGCGFRDTILSVHASLQLLDVAAAERTVGMVELGGLNQGAALVEAGLSVDTWVGAVVHEYGILDPPREYL